MNPLAEMLSLLEPLSWAERRCVIRKTSSGVMLQRGGMQAAVTNADGGLVEIVYEQALHETAHERLPPADAAKFILAIFRRQRLCRVQVSETESGDSL